MSALESLNYFFWWEPIDWILTPLVGRDSWTYVLVFCVCFIALFILGIIVMIKAVERIRVPPGIAQRGLAASTTGLTGWIILGTISPFLAGLINRWLWPVVLLLLASFAFFLVAALKSRQDAAENGLAASLNMEPVGALSHQTFEGSILGLRSILVLKDGDNPQGSILFSLEAPAPFAREAVIVSWKDPGETPVSEFLLPSLATPGGWNSAWSFHGRVSAEIFARFSRAPSPEGWAIDGAGLSRLSLRDGAMTCEFACSSLDPNLAMALAEKVLAYVR